MGYSCSKAAMDTVKRIESLICVGKSSNQWDNAGKTYFYQIGRENRDGAITGSVWRLTERSPSTGQQLCSKAGSFKVAADGKIVRWTALPDGIKPLVQQLNSAEEWHKAKFGVAL